MSIIYFLGKQTFLKGVVFSIGFFLTFFAVFFTYAAWTMISTQSPGATINDVKWNDLVNAINTLGNKVDVLESIGGGGSGSVAQIITKTSTVTSNLNVTTFTEANTDYRISFTPKLSNSKVLIEYYFPINAAMAGNTVFNFLLLRDIGGTEIPVGVGPVNGTRNKVTWVGRPGNGYDVNDQQMIYMTAVDTGLTQGVTYTYGFKYRRETGGSGVCYFNASNGDSAVYGFSGQMLMKITEIAQ